MLLTIIFLLPILFIHSIHGAPVEPEPKIKAMKIIPRISDEFDANEREILEIGLGDVGLLVESIIYGNKQVVDAIYNNYFTVEDKSKVFGE